MAVFRRGIDAEDRICTKLEGYGCRLQRDPRLDHKQKLDFVIVNFIDNPAFYSVGVQITTKFDVLEKQQEFLRANQGSRITSKALYLELAERVDLEDGGALTVLAVILGCQFNREKGSEKILAARIYEDLTYEYFDLAARVRQLAEKAEQAQPRPGPVSAAPVQTLIGKYQDVSSRPSPGAPIFGMAGAATAMALETANAQGTITTYYRSGGNGFIKTAADETFFFHISNVADDRLRDELNSIPHNAGPRAVEIPVAFANAGITRPGAKYPEARRVKLAG